MTGPAAIEAAGVVVPAHNEEALLPACLAALRRAARAVRMPVHVLVVADTCTDKTDAIAQACGARVISIRARNVGAARAAGMTEMLRLTARSDPARVWLATTDADTTVPPGWLGRQLRYADRGWDVVLGTVEVADWDGHPPHVPAAFDALYEFGAGPHPHVHGANLGLRASAYLAAGGFRPLRTAEDHALLAAATEAGCSVVQACEITVQTSARRQARAPRGFSHLLQTLAPLPNEPAEPLSGQSRGRCPTGPSRAVPARPAGRRPTGPAARVLRQPAGRPLQRGGEQGFLRGVLAPVELPVPADSAARTCGAFSRSSFLHVPVRPSARSHHEVRAPAFLSTSHGSYSARHDVLVLTSSPA